MDIGDLGFLIIAFIVFIVNFIAKANKEKTQAQPEKQVPAKPELPEPWEMTETLPLPIDSPYSRDKKAEASKRGFSLPSPSSQESYENMKKRLQTPQEGISSLSDSLFKDDNMDNISYKDEGSENTSYSNELFEGNITEEFRKAIIYSEILHRKYE